MLKLDPDAFLISYIAFCQISLRFRDPQDMYTGDTSVLKQGNDTCHSIMQATEIGKYLSDNVYDV